MTVHTDIGIDPSILKARKPKRLPVAVDVELRTAEDAVIPARLVDFSRRGFGVQCNALILIGSTIEIKLPRLGWVEATVRWSIGNRVGGWFLHEIAPDSWLEKFAKKQSMKRPPAVD